ncbi:hypothetical protein ED352_13985, partial [Muribaculaceae bacterium Isolate-002 (NCI)]
SGGSHGPLHAPGQRGKSGSCGLPGQSGRLPRGAPGAARRALCGRRASQVKCSKPEAKNHD